MEETDISAYVVIANPWTHAIAHVPPGVLNVKDADLRVSGSSYQSSITGMWHELDREDIGRVARVDHSREFEGRERILWQVCVYVEKSVVGPRSQKLT